MKTMLTTRGIETMHPHEKQYTAWDTGLKSFGIRISPKGTKTFIVMRGKDRKVTTLGRFPELSLKDARVKAMEEITAKPTQLSSDPEKAIEAFAEDVRARVKPDTLAQYLSYLNQMKLTSLDMTHAEVLEKLTPWRGKPWAQNYAHATLRLFLNWCVEHGYIGKTPLFRKPVPNKVRSRDRVLNDSELARIWRCTEDNTYGYMLRLLMLTGQRRMEVRKLKPEDVADGLITFHTKGDRINVLPVTPLVKENLKLPFSFNSWGWAKARFDTECGVDFRHHDLRRTLATKLAGMGVSFEVIERILGHARMGVAYVYNRHSYLNEVKQALLLYERHILRVAGQSTS